MTPRVTGWWWVGVGVALLSACAPQPFENASRSQAPAVQRETPPRAIPQAPAPALSKSLPQPMSARQSLQFTRSQHDGVTLQGVAFDAREYRMRVVDQKHGPGSAYADAEAAARATAGLAAVNAGFFTPEGSPLGLVVAEGVTAGAWNSASSLGSALWQEAQSGEMAIVRRSAHAKSNSRNLRNLLQAGPLLLDQGDVVGGLENSKSSARTLLLWDGGQRWWIGCTSPVTLAKLSVLLARKPPVAWQPRLALNLDGGRSSELWVSPAVAGTEISTRLPWNRDVRNFLVLLPLH